MKINIFKVLSRALILGVISLNLVSCSNNTALAEGERKIISVSGSTSVGPIMEKLAEEYEMNNPGISIEINQVGSSAGIKDTINEVVELGMSSRELKDEEKLQVDETIIAYDGIAMIVNNNNSVENLSIEHIRDIYTGKITNWNQIEGGENSPIVVISREDGSGTRDAFQEIIGFSPEELRVDALISNGNGGIKEIVAGNKNAIAFVSFEYLDDSIKALKVDNIEATPTEVINRNYKISRAFLLLNKKGNETEKVENIKNFILSYEGQKIVLENSLIPVK